MNPKEMHLVLENLSDEVMVGGNSFDFVYESVALTLIFDESADRMRLIAPIVPVEHLEAGQERAALEANFHTALDARYAIANDMMWAAFIHPLGDLSPDLLRSAVHQVAVAALTFGDQYTSGAMVFVGQVHPGLEN